MKKFQVEYCVSAVNYYASYAKREYRREYVDSYDSENYGYSDSREFIERRLNHRSFSIESLIEI